MKKIIKLLAFPLIAIILMAGSNHVCNKDATDKCSGAVASKTIELGGSYSASGATAGKDKCSECGKNETPHKITYNTSNLNASKPGSYTITATCDKGCSISSGTVIVLECKNCKELDKKIKEKIKEIKKHQEKLKKEAKDMNGEDAILKALKKDLEKQDKELDETVKKNEKALRAKKVAEQSKTRWQKDIAANNKEIKKLEMEIRQIKAKSTVLTWIVDKVTIAAKNSEIAVLKTENTLKQNDLVKAIADFTTATAELLQLDKIIPGLRKAIADLKASISEAEKSIQKLKESVKKLNEHSEFLKLELDDLNLQKKQCIESH